MEETKLSSALPMDNLTIGETKIIESDLIAIKNDTTNSTKNLVRTSGITIQTIANGLVESKVNFGTSVETGSTWNVTNNNTFSAGITGIYLICLNIAWDGAIPPDNLASYYIKRSDNFTWTHRVNDSTLSNIMLSCVMKLTAGQSFYVGILHNGSINRSIGNSDDNFSNRLSVIKVG